MKNIKATVEGNILKVEVDLTETFGPSKSGKTIIIASTEGNQPIAPGVFAGINVYKKAG